MTDWFVRPNTTSAPSSSKGVSWSPSTILRVGVMAILSVPRSSTNGSFDPFYASSVTASLNGHSINNTVLDIFFNDLATQVATPSAQLQFSPFQDVSTTTVCKPGDNNADGTQGAATVIFRIISPVAAVQRNVSMTVCTETSTDALHQFSAVQLVSTD